MIRHLAFYTMLVVFGACASSAYAQHRGIECRENVPGSCGGGGRSSGGKSSSSNSTQQLLGLGAAMIIQGLSNTDSDDSDDAEDQRRQLEYERSRQADLLKEQNAKSEAARMLKESANADGTNPFGKSSKKSGQTKDASAARVSLGAKFVDPSCITFKPMGRDRFTEDAIWVASKCAVPVEVLVCFKTAKVTCDRGTSVGWQVTRTIVKGEQTLTIAPGRPPYKFEYFVCDMTAKNGKKPLCLRPKA